MSLLVTVTGPDHPGVTACADGRAGACEAVVEDVEQVVVHGRLLLGLVIRGPGDGTARATALVQAARTGSASRSSSTDLDDAEPPVTPGRHHVVVLARPCPRRPSPESTRRLAACGANIERIDRLSTWPAQSFELIVSGGDTDRLRSELAAEAVAQAGRHRRRARLDLPPGQAAGRAWTSTRRWCRAR